MRLAFFSDVHANLEALEAFLRDAADEKVDKLHFLGDAVGYGPDPNECVKKICEVSGIRLMGNHDYAAMGLLDTSSFNQFAQEAIDYTRRVLSEESIALMADFSLEETIDDFHLVHATPERPHQWDYIVTLEDAAVNFPHIRKRVCLIGHSHYPAIISRNNGASPILVHEDSIKIKKKQEYIINIGSVGQPRDSNPRSCYLIYDSKEKTARLKRVEYDIAATQKKMADAGLPEYLITRLAKGR